MYLHNSTGLVDAVLDQDEVNIQIWRHFVFQLLEGIDELLPKATRGSAIAHSSGCAEHS